MFERVQKFHSFAHAASANHPFAGRELCAHTALQRPLDQGQNILITECSIAIVYGKTVPTNYCLINFE